ncbi:MAG: alpha/beta hydrolase [Planctomycetota bacterium]
MATPRVALLPGNGWADVRAEPARAALAAAGDPFALEVCSYPAAATFEELLTALDARLGACDPAVVHATGIGGLVALALRARGHLRGRRLVLQGAVLWGLEQRRFPRLMRLPGMPRLLVAMLRTAPIRRRFARKHFLANHDAAFLERFFAGYADAGEFARWFAWLTPSLLRQLERELTLEAMANLSAWWGELDHVVGLDELRQTERALGVTIPVQRFPDWGHYPMLDAPASWVKEVARDLEVPAAGAG